ncbi:MAG: hypothetical protein ACOCRX_07515 [Candidatus Woesearchaeota archaeon]
MKKFNIKSDYADIDEEVEAKSKLKALNKIFNRKGWDINAYPINDLFEIEEK